VDYSAFLIRGAIVAGDDNKLKLGKANAFVKSQLKRLRQEDETWEADFRALPKPNAKSATHYIGMVLTQPDGFLEGVRSVKRFLRGSGCAYASTQNRLPNMTPSTQPLEACPFVFVICRQMLGRFTSITQSPSLGPFEPHFRIPFGT
jgi:hypothetical protein